MSQDQRGVTTMPMPTRIQMPTSNDWPFMQAFSPLNATELQSFVKHCRVNPFAVIGARILLAELMIVDQYQGKVVMHATSVLGLLFDPADQGAKISIQLGKDYLEFQAYSGYSNTLPTIVHLLEESNMSTAPAKREERLYLYTIFS